MTSALVFPIDKLGVAKCDILDDPGEGDVAHLDRQKDMRCPQAKGVDTVSESRGAFRQL